MRRVAAALLVLLLCGGGPPAAGAPAGQVRNEEVVRAELDPSGLPTEATLISRITAPAGPRREILDPGSTVNIRYLDRRGAPRVRPGGVLIPVGGDQPTTAITEADFDRPLPVALHAEYRVAGKVVDPAEAVGARGAVDVVYTVTNTTAKRESITAAGADGRVRAERLPVFVPFAGELAVSIPRGMRVREAAGAAMSVDPSGATVLRYDVLLAPPAGDFQQEFTVRIQAASGAATPEVTLVVAPTTGVQSPALGFAQQLAAGSVGSATKLAEGLGQLDAGGARLADGAGDLAAGAGQLADGQRELADGLVGGSAGADAVAAGASALADGLRQLSAGLSAFAGQLPAAVGGARQLRDAAALLAGLVGSSVDGPWRPEIRWPDGEALPPWPPQAEDLPEWLQGLQQLPLQDLGFEPDGRPRDGVCELDTTGDGRFDRPVRDLDCVPTLVQSLRLLAVATSKAGVVAAEVPQLLQEAGREVAGAGSSVEAARSGASAAAAAAAQLREQVCGPAPSLSPGQCALLDGAAVAADGAVAAADEAIAALGRAGPPAAGAAARSTVLAVGLPALAGLLVALGELAARVGDGLSSAGERPGLVQGLEALAAGLEQAAGAAGQLAGGGAAAASGAGELAHGAARLGDGLRRAAAGAALLAHGGRQLQFGADALAGGAAALQQGTAAALEGVVAGSVDAAFAQAYLEAVDRRAAEALPYGPPEGAVGDAAYLLRMAPVAPGTGWAGWGATVLAALLVAVFGAALVRRGTNV